MASREEKLAALRASREGRASIDATNAAPATTTASATAGGDDREAKLAALRAARGKEVAAEDVAERNRAALANKKMDSFQNKATAAGMDISGLDPSIREFLAGNIKTEDMLARRDK